jgi:hypothetical protein
MASLHGHGDYVLSNASKYYFVPDQVWRCKTKEEKEKIFTNFMRDNRKKRTAGMSYNFSTRSGVVCGFQFTALLKM